MGNNKMIYDPHKPRLRIQSTATAQRRGGFLNDLVERLGALMYPYSQQRGAKMSMAGILVETHKFMFQGCQDTVRCQMFEGSSDPPFSPLPLTTKPMTFGGLYLHLNVVVLCHSGDPTDQGGTRHRKRVGLPCAQSKHLSS